MMSTFENDDASMEQVRERVRPSGQSSNTSTKRQDKVKIRVQMPEPRVEVELESEPRVIIGLPEVREGQSRAGYEAGARLAQDGNKIECRAGSGLKLWRNKAGDGLGETSTGKRKI